MIMYKLYNKNKIYFWIINLIFILLYYKYGDIGFFKHLIKYRIYFVRDTYGHIYRNFDKFIVKIFR